MFDILSTIFWGLLLLIIIVFIHEVGHFLAARVFGLRVKEFMIGLPGPKVAFRRKDTLYGVTAIPFGGYCLIAGMEKGEETDDLEKALTFISYFGQVCEEEADRSGEELGFDLVRALDTLNDWGTVRRFKANGLYHYAIAQATIDGASYKEGQIRSIANPKAFLAAERKLTYSSLPWWKRVVILLAGSFSNLLVAFAVLVTILMILGAQVATTTVDTVVEGSPADEAGIVSGDVLTSVNGKHFEDWEGFITSVQDLAVGDEIELGYTHNGMSKEATITLADNEGTPMVGVTSLAERQEIDFFQASQVAFLLVGSVLEAIFQLFNPATFADTIGQSSSVVGISIEARSAADSGPLNFIVLIAALSISIGFMNLLPIPPLDGGKIIIETIERISRRKLPASVINGISFVGFAAIIVLVILATNADIQRYFLGG